MADLYEVITRDGKRVEVRAEEDPEVDFDKSGGRVLSFGGSYNEDYEGEFYNPQGYRLIQKSEDFEDEEESEDSDESEDDE